MTTFQLNFHNDDIPVKTCVTNQMLNDVPSSTNQILNVSTLNVLISNHYIWEYLDIMKQDIYSISKAARRLRALMRSIFSQRN